MGVAHFHIYYFSIIPMKNLQKIDMPKIFGVAHFSPLKNCRLNYVSTIAILTHNSGSQVILHYSFKKRSTSVIVRSFSIQKVVRNSDEQAHLHYSLLISLRMSYVSRGGHAHITGVLAIGLGGLDDLAASNPACLLGALISQLNATFP